MQQILIQQHSWWWRQIVVLCGASMMVIFSAMGSPDGPDTAVDNSRNRCIQTLRNVLRWSQYEEEEGERQPLGSVPCSTFKSDYKDLCRPEFEGGLQGKDRKDLCGNREAIGCLQSFCIYQEISSLPIK